MRRLLLVSLLLPALGQAEVHYRLTPLPTAQSFNVSVTIDQPKPQETFAIPAWTPGYYVLQPFHTKISGFKATDSAGKKLEVTVKDPHTWSIATAGASKVIVSYQVLGDEPGLGILASSVQKDSAFANGPSVFVYNPARMKESVALEVVRPDGWDLAIPLEESKPNHFRAGGYDELADSPIQLGKMVKRSFKVEGIPCDAVFVTTPGVGLSPDPDAEAKLMAQVSGPAVRMFKGAPFKRYLFVVHLSSEGFQGGLEHRNSQVLALTNQVNLGAADLYCHEFFHAWNVKQIRPAVLGPFDYAHPCRTANLWFAEGVTDYYAKILTYRSGAKDRAWLLGELSDQYQTYEFSSDRKLHTVEEASKQAWENGGFTLGDLDYYNKGLLAGLIFDAAIRKETGNRKSLDDVMRLLYSRHRLPLPGYGEDELLKTINEAAGKDLSKLYQKMIRSSESLPYEGLKTLGLRALVANQGIQTAGFDTQFGKVSRVSTEAASAGVKEGDIVLQYDPAEKGFTNVQLLRNGERVKVKAPLGIGRAYRVEMEWDPEVDTETAKARELWLSAG